MRRVAALGFLLPLLVVFTAAEVVERLWYLRLPWWERDDPGADPDAR